MKTKQASTKYHLLVIGANGGIGRQAVELALEAGHRLTALVRNPDNLLLTHLNLEIVQADIRQSETFEQYLANKDGIISAIGEKMDHPTTLYSEGNRNLLKAMKNTGVRRAFFISASAIEISPVQPWYIRLATRYIVQKLFGHGYADQRIMEALIKVSGLDWTIMRPPRLTDMPVTGHYRFAINAFLNNCLRISRSDVAHFMINNLHNAATYQATIEIGY